MQRLSFLCTDGTLDCPYPEHMENTREPWQLYGDLAWKRLKNGSISDIVFLHIFIYSLPSHLFGIRCSSVVRNDRRSDGEMQNQSYMLGDSL